MTKPSEPHFSIIMPTYNRAFCIKDAINSVLAQEYPHYELIIVDDGSADGTAEIIKNDYVAELSSGKIVFESLPHGGVCKARNHGLTLAKNDWIAYIDTDNLIVPDFLETFSEAIKHNTAKVYYAQIKQRYSGKIHGREFDYDSLCRGNFIDMGALVHHRSLFKKLGGFDENLTRVVDWDLVLTYTKKYKPIYIPKIVVDYNDSKDFERISTTENVEINVARLYEKHLPPLPKIRKSNILGFIRYSCCCLKQFNKNIFTEEYLSYRFKIFEQVTLPSLVSQTDRNFNIVLLHSTELPLKYKNRFLKLSHKYPFLHNVYIDPEKGSMNQSISDAAHEYLDLNKKAVATFRLDNDDALPKHYIETMRQYIRPQYNNYSISLPNVVVVQHVGDDEYLRWNWNYPSNSIGLLFVSPPAELKTVMNLGHHGKISKTYPQLLLPQHGGIQTLNGENLANFFCKPDEVMKVSEVELMAALAENFPKINLSCLRINPEMQDKRLCVEVKSKVCN